jgi:hypothetical protein
VRARAGTDHMRLSNGDGGGYRKAVAVNGRRWRPCGGEYWREATDLGLG